MSQEQNKRLKEEEEEMKRSMTYLTLLDKHEQAAKKRNVRAARNQIVRFNIIFNINNNNINNNNNNKKKQQQYDVK